MESLAFIHSAVDYEDPNPVAQLRSIDEITSAIPTSAIMSVAGAAVAIGVLTQAPDADAALRRGNVCSSVTTLQSTLQRNGYSVGGADGAFGNNTEFAVKQFQRNNGLARDGIVGPATASRMGLNPNISCAGSGGPGGGNPGGGSGAPVRVTARSGLNIRSGPSTGNSIIGTLPYNAVVRVRVSTGSSGFAQLLNGGWISSQYITDASSNPGNGGGSGVGGGSPARVVAGIGVKIRSGPGLGYAQIGGAGFGETVRLTGERVSRDGYRWAKLSGRSGWVATAGLNVN